jgi:nicotinate-nucleotide adenylyltransferase
VVVDFPQTLFYGGAFDPPHNGHLELLKTCGEFFKEATVKIFVDKRPPPLGGQQKKPTLFEHRKQMLQLLLGELSRGPETEILTEKDSDGPQYAIDRLRALGLGASSPKPAWIFGDDQWLSFDRWHEWKEISTLVDFMIIPRSHPPKEIPAQYEKLFGEWTGDINLSRGWKTQIEQTPGLPRIYYFSEPISSVSSTNIRNQNIDLKNNLPKPILEYIQKNGLYQNQ